jgi:ABC-2 type transport system ATP-binding protein
LVSHTMETIKQYCSRAAFMKNGELIYFGDTQKAIEMYTEDNH